MALRARGNVADAWFVDGCGRSHKSVLHNRTGLRSKVDVGSHALYANSNEVAEEGYIIEWLFALTMKSYLHGLSMDAGGD